jgi:hypothetical protein
VKRFYNDGAKVRPMEGECRKSVFKERRCITLSAWSGGAVQKQQRLPRSAEVRRRTAANVGAVPTAKRALKKCCVKRTEKKDTELRDGRFGRSDAKRMTSAQRRRRRRRGRHSASVAKCLTFARRTTVRTERTARVVPQSFHKCQTR